jgi:hypothetical protein
MKILKYTALCVLILALVSACTNNPGDKEVPASKSNPGTSGRLYDEIKRMDSLMFEAFNAHDADKLQTYFSEDLEFYHDQGGLADLKLTMENSKALFERNKTTGLRRDLVKGSLEVYPIKDYGAVETCLHRFCHKENGKDDCGVFKNIMIWQNKNGEWKVTRVISYDH